MKVSTSVDDSLQILGKKYANGEIIQEEFEKIKKELI